MAGAVRQAERGGAGQLRQCDGLGDPARVVHPRRRPDDQRRHELGGRLLAGAGDGQERLGVVEGVGGADARRPGIDRAEYEAPHDIGGQRAVAPQVARADDDADGGPAGLAQHRPQAVPRALRARLEGGPGTARVEGLEHPGADLREGGRGGGEVVGAHGRAPRERGEVAQGGIDIADGVGCWRHVSPFDDPVVTRIRPARSRRACGCRSSGGRPRSRTGARRSRRRSRPWPASGRWRRCPP